MQRDVVLGIVLILVLIALLFLTGCPKVSTVRQTEFCPPRWAMFNGEVISNAAWEEVRWCRDLPNDRIDPKGEGQINDYPFLALR